MGYDAVSVMGIVSFLLLTLFLNDHVFYVIWLCGNFYMSLIDF
jgi:hypothetical protein